ncbi:MAG: tetratricopeptide repeat protein, partial [Acidobacteriota bacterium]
MPELREHLDDFTLLLYAVQELPEPAYQSAEAHLRECEGCSAVAREITRLDAELRDVAARGAFASEPAVNELPADDPFRSRPELVSSSPRTGGMDAVTRAIAASERAGVIRERLLDASRQPALLSDAISALSMENADARYGLLYALQESGRHIAAGPARSLRLAEAALDLFRRTPAVFAAEPAEAEASVPMTLLRGQAHLLAGQACNWVQDFDLGGTHLKLAYRCFSRGGDEVGLALVEHIEAQRRFLTNRGEEALVLAKRARASFQSFELDELAAKADVAVGSALATLGREEEALPLLRSALDFFEKRGIWTNYVGTLNNLGASLHRLNRLDEARREYARALRRMSRERDASLLAIIRHGLADVLFAAGRYREAAGSFSQTARLYRDLALPARALIASLYEIESWARSGDLGRAHHRL